MSTRKLLGAERKRWLWCEKCPCHWASSPLLRFCFHSHLLYHILPPLTSPEKLVLLWSQEPLGAGSGGPAESGGTVVCVPLLCRSSLLPPQAPRSGAACFAGSRSHSTTLDTKAVLCGGSKLPLWATLSHSVFYQQEPLSLEIRSHLIHCLLEMLISSTKPLLHTISWRQD